jgi:hypothetical protein
MPPHYPNIVTLRPRSLANVLLDLKEARRDWEQAIDEIARLPIGAPEADDADDRASEADTRVDDLRDEFTARFHEATGLTWKQIEDAISEAVL